MILRLLLWYFYYGNGKSNRGTVIVVKRFFSLAKTIVVDVFVTYIPRIPLWYFFVMGMPAPSVIKIVKYCGVMGGEGHWGAPKSNKQNSVPHLCH